MRMIVPKDSFSTSASTRTSSTSTTIRKTKSLSSSTSSAAACDPPPPPPPPPPPRPLGKTKRDHGGTGTAAVGVNNNNPFICMRRPKPPPPPSLSSHFQRLQRYQQQQQQKRSPRQQQQQNQQQDQHSRTSGNNKNNNMRLYNAQSCTPLATTNSHNNNFTTGNKSTMLSSRSQQTRGKFVLPPPPPPPPPPRAPVKKSRVESNQHQDLLDVALAHSSSTDESGKWSSSPMINNNDKDITSWDKVVNQHHSKQRHALLSKPVVQHAQQSVSQNSSSSSSAKSLTGNNNNNNNRSVSKFSKTNADTTIVVESSSSLSSASGDKNATWSKSNSDSSGGSKSSRSKKVSKTNQSDTTSTVLSSSFSSETSDKQMATTDKNKVGKSSNNCDTETAATTTTTRPDDPVAPLKQTEGTTPQKWQGGRGYHYTAPHNDRHNRLEAAAPKGAGEEHHHYNYMYGKTLVKSKFGIYSNNNNNKEEMLLHPSDKDENTSSGTGQLLLQIPKTETESTTATTNTEVPPLDDDEEDASSASDENENNDDDDDMHILHHYSSSSGSSSFHFDIDVVKNIQSSNGQQQRNDVDAAAVAGADKNAAFLMTTGEEHASCFLSKSSSSTLTTLPPTPFHHHQSTESRNPPNEPRREMGSNNHDRIHSFLLQQQRQHPPVGRSTFSRPPPASPLDFEPYTGNKFSEDETDFNFPAPTKVERQKVSSTDPFWASREHHHRPLETELSLQVYNKRSVDTGDDQPAASMSVFGSAWSSVDVMQSWSAADNEEDSSWIDFTADPFQAGQAAMTHIKKPSPTKPRGGGGGGCGALATGHFYPSSHGDYNNKNNTVAHIPTKTLSSSPDGVYASHHVQDETAWNPSLHGFSSHHDTNPTTTGSAFARYLSSNPVDTLSHAKQQEVQQPSVVQPGNREMQGPAVHSSLARPNNDSDSNSTGPTLAPHLLLTQPNSVNDNGQQQLDPVSAKHEKQQEQHRRGPLLLGPLLEARYRSLRNAGSYDETLGNQHPVMSRNGPRWVTPVVRNTWTEDNESSLLTSSSLLRESLLSKTTYDTGLLATSRDHEDSQGPFDDTLSQLPERYRKMIQLGLPADVIHDAMRRDGVAPALLPPSSDTGNLKSCNFPRSEREKTDPCRRFQINWDTHTNVHNTLWAMVGRDELWMKEAIQIDEDEFACLFQHQQDPLGPSRLDGITSARVIDPKRANNGDSILARFALSYREISRAIDSYDYECLTLDQIRILLPYIPAPHEVFKLRDHIMKAGGRHLLKSECEKFMAEMLSVEKPKEKLHAMLFMKRFPLVMEDMKSNSRLIRKASDEIMSSSRLRRVLGVILHLGNKINKAGPGTSNASATAIRLQSLVNLGKPKALDRKTSFMHYNATILRKSNPDLIQFNDDLPNLQRAAKVNWAELQEEVECLEVSVSNIRELALLAPFADNTSTPILSPDEEVGVLQSTSIGRFTLEACIQMAVVYHEVEACKQALEALLTYFGERNSEGSYSGVAGPETVFPALALFAKNFESAVEQSVAREKERSIRDCRTTASVLISSSNTHCDKAPQRALEQIRDVLGAIRCKAMSSED